MNRREQYHAAYTALENEAKAGRRSWESVCAQIAMLSIELGAAEADDRAQAERHAAYERGWNAACDAAGGV